MAAPEDRRTPPFFVNSWRHGNIAGPKTLASGSTLANG
jgi:hypothetical protein